MTCIVGLIEDNKVYIGGDSAGVSGSHITKRKDTKVFERYGVLIGYTSSFRMGQLLRFKLIVPPKKCNDLYEYMCTDFVDAIRKCLSDGGFAQKTNGEETGGYFLVGIENRLFKIENDYQVGESFKSYEAVGSGEDYAKGCLYSVCDDKQLSPQEKIYMALAASAEFSGSVCAPFIIKELE